MLHTCFHLFSIHSLMHTHTLFLPSSIPLTVLLLLLQLFCIHFHYLHFLYFTWLSTSLHYTLFPSLFLCVCVCVYVALWCVWLFFRQQPRRLDCHNLWSWVISVCTPNLGTGPFFLSSTIIPSALFSHHLSLCCPFLSAFTVYAVSYDQKLVCFHQC